MLKNFRVTFCLCSMCFAVVAISCGVRSEVVVVDATDVLFITNTQLTGTDQGVSGTVVSVEETGAAVNENHTPKFTLEVKSKNGTTYVFKDFFALRHREDEIRNLIGQRCMFPDKLYELAMMEDTM